MIIVVMMRSPLCGSRTNGEHVMLTPGPLTCRAFGNAKRGGVSRGSPALGQQDNRVFVVPRSLCSKAEAGSKREHRMKITSVFFFRCVITLALHSPPLAGIMTQRTPKAGRAQARPIPFLDRKRTLPTKCETTHGKPTCCVSRMVQCIRPVLAGGAVSLRKLVLEWLAPATV